MREYKKKSSFYRHLVFGNVCLLIVCLSVHPDRKHNHTCTHREREEIIESIEMQNKQMRMTHNFNDRFLATINTHISFVCRMGRPLFSERVFILFSMDIASDTIDWISSCDIELHGILVFQNVRTTAFHCSSAANRCF